MENTRVENPVTPEVFIQVMAELGISFPLACSERDMGVLLDADGDELLTVDSSGSMPDNTVALLCANIVMVLNNAASLAVREPLDWITVAKLAGELGIRYPTNTAMETFLKKVSGDPVPSVVVNAVEAVWKQSLVIESNVRRGDGPCQYRDVKEALELVKQARSALSAQAQDAEEQLTPEEAWTILCETPDITSPEEYPDHALITREQLTSFMERAAPTTQAEPSSSELLTLVKLFRDTLQYYIRRDEKTGDSEGASLKRNTLGVVINAIAKAEGVSELSMLETHLKSLVIANPEKALLAALDDDMRMWFLAELIAAVASGSIPLTEIEAIVSRHLTPAKGGAA